MYRIEVGFKPNIIDALGESTKKRIIENLQILVKSVKTIDVYTIDANLSKKQLNILGESLFADPIIQRFSFDKSQAKNFSWLIEVGFKPGVTDNVGKTSKQAIEDILKIKLKGGVYTSKQYLIKGNITRQDTERIAKDLLANDLIQRWITLDYDTWKKQCIKTNVPKVKIPHTPETKEIGLNIPEKELIKISKDHSLALNLEEMLAIKRYFNDPKVIEKRKKLNLSNKPTDVELETLAQTWSEHCKHKIFNGEVEYECNGKKEKIDSLFKTYIKKSTEKINKDWVASVFWDNAGVMKFNKDWLFAFKCETHNSPSNMEPYGGAITGIVGVYRDPMGTGKGAKLLYGAYGFCVGHQDYSGKLRPLLHPKRLLEGVRKGVEDGGNKSGIPTPLGFVLFDDGYMGKCVIYVSTGGIIPATINGEPGHKKKINSEDLVVMVGGRVGIDGIHGATASSEEYHENTPAGHVQIGDPITQKKMLDFILEARDSGLYNFIQDVGGGGASSAIGETARVSNGCQVYLDKFPLKYSGLDPWQIFLSESQERMLLAVPPEKKQKLFKLAKKHDVELTSIGKYTNSGNLHLLYKGNTVAYMDMDFLHGGFPKKRLKAKWKLPKHEEPKLGKVGCERLLRKMLSRPNVCSKEYIVRQFDHEVQGTSVIKPLVGKENDVVSDAVVIRPVLDTFEGLAISVGINPKYSQIDTYHMTACSLDEAIRRIIAVGGSLKQIAFNDNFCWPSPLKDEYKMAQLVRANKALYDYTIAFGTPCISGKDSMSIDGMIPDVDGKIHHVSGLPTLQFSAAGKIEDIRKCVTMDAKKLDDKVYVIGLTKDELGGSEYYEMLGYVGNDVPKVDAKESVEVYDALTQAIEKGLVASVHGCYRGGLSVALTQTAFAGMLGMEIDLSKVPVDALERDDKILFSESAGRFVVTVSPENSERFEKLMKGNFARIGTVTDERFVVKGLDGDVIVDADIKELKESWKSPMRW